MQKNIFSVLQQNDSGDEESKPQKDNEKRQRSIPLKYTIDKKTKQEGPSLAVEEVKKESTQHVKKEEKEGPKTKGVSDQPHPKDR
jgi:hypothetical protein